MKKNPSKPKAALKIEEGLEARVSTSFDGIHWLAGDWVHGLAVIPITIDCLDSEHTRIDIREKSI